jgi:hypothetical protein
MDLFHGPSFPSPLMGNGINLRGNTALNEIPTFSHTSLSPSRERKEI